MFETDRESIYVKHFIINNICDKENHFNKYKETNIKEKRKGDTTQSGGGLSF